jgi:hypothetical protein
MYGGLSETLHRPELLILVSVVAAALVATAIVLWRRRKSPEEAERQRRELIYRRGRLLDGTVTELHDGTISFAYSVAGVEYRATQCISSIANGLEDQVHKSLGPATIKYLPNNPANSIVVCEFWSGLRENNPNQLLGGATGLLSRPAGTPQSIENGRPIR